MKRRLTRDPKPADLALVGQRLGNQTRQKEAVKSRLAPILTGFRRASRVGDLDPTILCAPLVAAIVGDGFGLAVALGREPLRRDAVLRQPRHHRLRARFRKRLVIRVVADVIRVALHLQLQRLIRRHHIGHRL